MIITNIQGGLGNQLFQYAISRSLSIKKRDIFKLDINFYNRQNLRKYELNLFKINENFASDFEINNLKGKESVLFKLKKRLNCKTSKPSTYFRESEKTIFDENVFNYKDNIYLDGYWQNEMYFKDIREYICNDFELRNENRIVMNRYLNDIKNKNSVSLHIRRGDYLKHPEIGVLSIEYYKKAINIINSKISNLKFYIFSDDKKWCREKFKFLKDKVLIDETKESVEDLTLMKHCKHSIIANSSFSWWGAWLNDNNDKIIISPRKWKVNDSNKYKLIPDSWLRI